MPLLDKIRTAPAGTAVQVFVVNEQAEATLQPALSPIIPVMQCMLFVTVGCPLIYPSRRPVLSLHPPISARVLFPLALARSL